WDWIPGASKELQVLWNMQYVPSRIPGFTAQEAGQHPWTLNVVDFADQVINTQKFLYNQPNFFHPYQWNQNGSFFEQSEVFLRWRGSVSEGLGEPFNDFTYSLHYGYLFNRVPLYVLRHRSDAGLAIDVAGPRLPRPGGGTTGGINFESRRYSFVGFSFDKALLWLPGQFEGTAFRGEASYNFGNFYYDPSLQVGRTDNTTFMLGLDQYLYLAPRNIIGTPWFTSWQIWQDWTIDKPGKGAYTKLDSQACANQPGCGKRGWIELGQYNLFKGMRQQQRTITTLFMFNDFLPGKVLHVELFGLAEFENMATWFRAVVGYNFTTALSARVGTNQIWGPSSSFFGQFGENDVIFTEFKWTF
ncbi:MAG: hypothetical protein AB7V27_18600, partial [Candidatus Binatia bacterium]